ncbi:hypothetical protein DOFOFD_02925 [Acetobacteraceae bacterium EV16P]|uniref:Metalloprotease TldD/E N-terminal domain-containing protein n=1 Tax=Sorlinia euscelidii TaxID=3081148 RepID=A0ABU7TZN5_9PROT
MTDALLTTDSLFFSSGAHLDTAMAGRCVRDLLNHFDDGELFLEYRESESIVLDDGVIRAAGFDVSSGFGLRGVIGAEVGFAHSDEISLTALREACEAVKTTQPDVGKAGKGA